MAAFFGRDCYSSATKTEQASFAIPQAFLIKRVLSELQTLKKSSATQAQVVDYFSEKNFDVDRLMSSTKSVIDAQLQKNTDVTLEQMMQQVAAKNANRLSQFSPSSYKL